MKEADNLLFIYSAVVFAIILLLASIVIRHMIKKWFARKRYLEKIIIRGEEGERETAEVLQKVRGKKYLVSNIYIPGYSGTGHQETTEIDMVMVHEKGIFVIENKNYSGWIFGRESDSNWLQVSGNRKKRYFYSPVRQNQGHIRYLKKLLNPLLDEDVPFISVITFNQNARLKKIRLDSGNIIVSSSNHIKQRLNRYLWLKRKRIRRDTMKEIIGVLEQQIKVTKKMKKEHIKNIRKHERKSCL